ncbi:MAG: TetR/AcrR family transcriptional regulator [Phycisphaerales bacterium]
MPKTDPSTCARLPGRPRCDETARSILKATFDLLKTHGLAALTIEGVAAKAGVGKATVYRWWPNRAVLAIDAFFAEMSPRIPFEDTGSVRGDFRAQMHRVVTEMNGRGGKVLASIVAAAQMDEDVAHAFRTRWLVPRRAEGMEAIKRGIERGELAADVDTEFLFDVLYSPLYFRLLIRHQPLTHEFADRVLTVGFAGLNPRLRKPAPPRRRAHIKSR